MVSPFRAMSFIIPLRGIKTIQPGCARGKTIQPPCGRWKCTPSVACGDVSPGGGDLHSASLSANLSRSLLSAAKTSPSGGSTAAGGDRGEFPTGRARLYGLPAADRRHLYWRPKGAHIHLPFTIHNLPFLQLFLPTGIYLPSLTSCTEILRCAQNDTSAGRLRSV